jgi:hypothetical protein
LPLITNLNLFKDNIPLKSDNYHDVGDRLFKSSIISPFSSNIAMVLLKCNDSQFKIKLLLNELPVGFIKAGKLKCTGNGTGNFKESICNHDIFKENLFNENRDCFKKNFCETFENEEL